MLLNYIPARITEGQTWHISFYVINPSSKKMVRKRVKLLRIKSVVERRKFARQLMHEINMKLAAGWNPLIEQEAGKSFHKFSDALDTFLRAKTKELRPDSIRSYNSIAKSIKEYLKKAGMENIYVDKNKEQLAKEVVVSFAADISESTGELIKSSISNTYQNYLNALSFQLSEHAEKTIELMPKIESKGIGFKVNPNQPVTDVDPLTDVTHVTPVTSVTHVTHQPDIKNYGNGTCPTCSHVFAKHSHNHKFCGDQCRVQFYVNKTGRTIVIKNTTYKPTKKL